MCCGASSLCQQRLLNPHFLYSSLDQTFCHILQHPPSLSLHKVSAMKYLHFSLNTLGGCTTVLPPENFLDILTHLKGRVLSSLPAIRCIPKGFNVYFTVTISKLFSCFISQFTTKVLHLPSASILAPQQAQESPAVCRGLEGPDW